jgi:hypothetical protein
MSSYTRIDEYKLTPNLIYHASQYFSCKQKKTPKGVF